MKSVSRRRLRLVALLAVCLQYAASAQEVPTVKSISIRHIGPRVVSDELIRANIRVREGDAFSQAAVDDDVTNLYGTGRFHNVQIFQEPVDIQQNAAGQRIPGGFKLVYQVQAKPVITEIRFSGNKKYSTSRLRKKVTSKTGEPMDERKLFTDKEEILKMYQKSGLQRTTVEFKPSINEELGKGVVTFEIVEAPKVRIKNVVFENAEAFRQRKLRRVVKTRRWWMFSWITGSGRFKDDQFEEDKEKLREFYADKGYIDFDIRDVKFDQPKTNRMILKIDVSEGPQYRVGNVEVKGNELFTTEQILQNLSSKDGEKFQRGLQLKPGEVFSPRRLFKDVEAIQDFYGARGYIEARVNDERVANIEKGTLDIRYQLSEGEKFYVEKILIQGNTKTKDKVIRRELAITPGETYDKVREKISKGRLEQMQFFEKVETKSEPTEVPNRKNLVIDVAEKNTGNIAMGAGFSSIDALVGFVEVSQGNFDLFNWPNFTGGGQKARLRAQVGSQRQDYVLTFVEPWFLNKRLSLSTDLYHRDLNFLSDNFNQQQTGGRLGLSRQLPFNLVGSVSYTLESIAIRFSDSYRNQFAGSPILLEGGRRLVSRVGASIAYDTRNNAQLPTRGKRIELMGDLAGGPFGGDSDFYKMEFRVAQYWSPVRLTKDTGILHDIFEGHVLELLGRAGVTEAYGDTSRVPLFDRWYLGGMFNLRGFRFREVGPRDFRSGEPVGGGTYWFSSAEYSIPIIERIRVAMFYDAGMVYPDAYSFDPRGGGRDASGDPRVRGTTGTYNDNWGFGLRLNLPIGPLRLDYGIPITADPNNQGSGRFQFGVGWTRDF
jgi:outer membrane protein insertion porin family